MQRMPNLHFDELLPSRYFVLQLPCRLRKVILQRLERSEQRISQVIAPADGEGLFEFATSGEVSFEQVVFELSRKGGS
jgi:hypothetical protein